MLNAFIMCYYHLVTTLVLFFLLTSISYHYSSYGCVQDLTIGVNAIIHLFLNNSLLRARKSQSIEGATKLGFHGVVTCRVSGDQNQPTEYLPTRDKVVTYSLGKLR